MKNGIKIAMCSGVLGFALAGLVSAGAPGGEKNASVEKLAAVMDKMESIDLNNDVSGAQELLGELYAGIGGGKGAAPVHLNARITASEAVGAVRSGERAIPVNKGLNFKSSHVVEEPEEDAVESSTDTAAGSAAAVEEAAADTEAASSGRKNGSDTGWFLSGLLGMLFVLLFVLIL